MIRPSRNLIFFGLIACSIMVPSFFYWNSLYAMIIPVMSLFLVATIDLFISLPTLTNFYLKLDDKVRGLSGNWFKVPIEIENKLSSELEVQFIFKGAKWAKEILELKVVAPANCKSQIFMEGLFAGRGKYNFGLVGVIIKSTFRLWELQRVYEINETINVYPSFHEQRKMLTGQLFNKNMIGFHQFRQVGKGKDFERLREYQPGDGFEDISWKATAKHGAPVSKVYQIEKTQEIYLAIDCSRLSMKKFKDEKGNENWLLEKYLEVAFLLGEYCALNGDKFGVVLFSDHIIKFVKAKAGKQHLKYCKEILFNLKPFDLSPDYGEVFTEIFERIPKRSFILFLSNLEDIAEAEIFSEKVNFISKKHLTLVQMMSTPDIKPIFTRDVSSISDIAVEISNHLRWIHIMQVKKLLKLKGVEFNLVDHPSFTLNAISSYVAIKQRQAI